MRNGGESWQMTGETIVLGLFVFYTAFVMIAGGIWQYKSKNPVGFWSGKEPPKEQEVTDIEAYNHKHGMMWILYGSGMIVIFCFGTILGTKAVMVILMLELIGGIILMALYHYRLEKRYVTKKAESNDREGG